MNNDTTTRTLYVVCGTCGEYSDREEWLVRAFDMEEDAETYITALQVARRMLPADEHRRFERMRMLDPNYQESYSDTGWFLQKCPYGISD